MSETIVDPHLSSDPAADPLEDDGGFETEVRSFGRQTWARLRRHRLAMFGLGGLVILAISFVVGPWLSPYDFDEITVDFNQGPSRSHPFGTDEIGRDLLVRTFIAGRFSLRIALVVAGLATALGTFFGAVAGYFGKWVDQIISQLINLVLVIPAIVILTVTALRYGSSPNSIAVLLALLLWTRIARVVRGLFFQLKEQEFVQAARAAGAGPARIMFRHILPNVVGPIMVEMTLLVGLAIILESTLSFLGLGVQPPNPTLGTLIDDTAGSIDSKPSKVLIPGGFVTLIVLCVNFLGDGLRDALDPTSRKLRE